MKAFYQKKEDTRSIMKSMNNPYLKRLLMLSIPLILHSLISQTQMLIDRMFLGHYNDLYMSALGNVNAPMWTTMSFCFAIVTGSSILISQAVGANDRESMEEQAGAMLKWNNFVPIILFFFCFFGSELVFKMMGVSENLIPMCVGYAKYSAPLFIIIGIEGSLSTIMQTSNYTKPLVVYGVLRSGLNIFLDWIMIFGRFGFPEMGIEGAALATTISEYIGIIYAFYIFFRKKELNTRPGWEKIKTAKLRPYIIAAKLGVNTALEDFAWNLGNLMIIRILNTINEMAAGIYSIIFGIEVIAVVIVGSIGRGTLTLTGEATGKKDVKQFNGICACAFKLCVVIGMITLAVCGTIPRQILSLFTNNTVIIASSSVFLLLTSINLFSKSANIIIGNGIRGSGNTGWMLGTQIYGTIFVVCMAAFFVFVCHLEILGVFFAVMLDELTRAIINFWKYKKIVGSWEKNEYMIQEPKLQ